LKIRHALLGAALALGLSACATPYGSAGLSGGYSETKLDDATYVVTFAGNGYTTAETVQTFWLYRCAELTLAQGYDGFEITSDVHLISNIRPAHDDGAVLIPVHGGSGGGGGHGGYHGYIFVPVYGGNAYKPVITGHIRMFKKPFTASPPNSFDAAELQQTLHPLVIEHLCDKNVCPHPHTYLGTLPSPPVNPNLVPQTKTSKT
jgi:hypothetical protein